MLLTKMNFKAIVLAVLTSMISFAFAQSQELAPLQISADDWDYLSNFKLFGQTGISFGNMVEFPNEAGWVGTATGDLYSTGNNGKVGGAIIVGGTIHPHSNMQFTTGPIRYGTGFTSGVYNGSVRCDGLTTSGSCKDVPLYRENLKVPSAGTISGITQSVPDRQELKIEMPYKGSYDVYFSSLSLGAEAAIIIELPDKKHAARLFIDKLNVNNHPMFLVKYKDENGYRCIAPSNKFQLSGRQAECVGDYEGNLVVYVNHDIKFGNTDNYPMDGTFIFNGTAEFISNFMFSGQIIAKELKLGSDINDKNFKFVKYMAPSKNVLSPKNTTFKESDTWQTVEIGLSDVATTEVSFSYCFDFYSETGIPGIYAGYQDVGMSDATHSFPICNENSSVSVSIPAGKTKAEGIYIKPLIGGLVEGNKALWVRIWDLSGASLSSDYEDGRGYKIFIESTEIPTVKSALVIDVNEDEAHAFTEAEFQFQHTTQNFASVIITEHPKGLLLLDGKAVAENQQIEVADFGKLTYQAVLNEFGNNYTSFKYKVVGDGDEGVNTSLEYTATVNVIPVNDQPSVADQTFTIAEKKSDGSDWPSGTLVGNVSTAIDSDDDPLTYSVVTTGVPFKFDNGSNQLVITDGSVLDFETKSTWTFDIQVSDGELSATATVTVNLEDVDEPSPSIVFDYEGDVLVNGNASTGDAIDNFTSNNSKEIQDQLSEIVSDLSYTLASNTSANVTDYFNIDTESGDITAKTELIFEALYPNYTFTIGVDATGLNASAEPVSVNISKKIVIKDVNEAPVITNEKPLVVSQSALNNGGIVGKVEAVDPDSCSYNPDYVCKNGSHPLGFNKLSYKIVEVLEVDGSSDFPFEIDPNTGVISVSKGPSLVKRYNFDYTSVVRKVASPSTTQKQYQFIVEVSDNSLDESNESKSIQKQMSIDVAEENTAPAFETVPSDYEVSENTSVGETFGDAILVYDGDATDANGLTVSIADKDECDAEKNCAQNLFEVVQDGETNEETHISQFKFKVKKDLDYEALYKEAEGKAAFNVTVTVTDGANHSVTGDVVIHVKDVNEGPTFEKASYVFTVAENTTIDDSNPVGTVVAKDPDVYNSAYGTIEYNLDGDDAIFFAINASGGITMKEEYTLDYETRSSYSFNANVSDGATTKSVPVTLNVTDVNEKPIFVEPTKTLAFSENEMESVIETLTFDDFDTESEFRNNKFECTNCDDYGFELNEDTGELKMTRTFDYETEAHSYDLYIVITDVKNADLTATGKITVNLKDVPEAPVFLVEGPLEFPVDENAENAEVGVVAAVDDDCKNDNPCSAPVYSLAGTDEYPDDYNSFTIDENTGAIKVYGKLDYETKSSYNFKVVVTNGDFSDDISVTVNVTDVNESPIFVEPTTRFVFSENAASTSFGNVPFDDYDTAATFRNNKFECTNCEENGFYLNENTGELKATRTFDYETDAHSYELNIVIKDAENADLTATGVVTVYLQNVPEAPEIVSTEFSVYENSPADSLIGVIKAIDPDGSTDLFFSLTEECPYVIVKSNGEVRVKEGANIDYETKSNFTIRVSVKDSDGLIMYSYIVINVIDVNDKPTMIAGSLVNFFYEHSGKNYLVGQLYAEDPDESSAFTDNVFKAVGGDTALFSISENGLIKTKRDFDYKNESRSVYSLFVTLSDRDSVKYPDHMTSAMVKITLKMSPNDPVSSSSSKPASSSSVKPASSSSKTNVASSSSKVYVASSSSKVYIASSSSKVYVASSSSQYFVKPESSASSSNSNTSEYAVPTFRVRMAAPFVFEIIMTEFSPSLAKQYAVMDMKGQVISVGELSDGTARVTVPTRGAYVVRVGLGYQRVNMK